MFNRSGAVLALTMLAACGSAATPSDGQAQAAARSAKPLDIAGVTIGMAGPKAASILEQGGWTVTAQPGDSWEETVAKRVNFQRGGVAYSDRKPSGVAGYSAKKGDEELGVTLTPTPQGGVVGQVDYYAPHAGRSNEEIRRQLVAKYGPPVPGRSARLTWQADRNADSLSFDDGMRMRLTLSAGRTEEAARKAVMDQAIAKSMGGGKPSF